MKTSIAVANAEHYRRLLRLQQLGLQIGKAEVALKDAKDAYDAYLAWSRVQSERDFGPYVP